MYKLIVREAYKTIELNETEAKNITFVEEAKFKLAVCYAALMEISEAKKLLQEIISEKGFYSSKAEEELEKLK